MRGAKRKAFESFDGGLRPSQVSVKGVKISTLYRYYQEWKRRRGLPPSSIQDRTSTIVKSVAPGLNKDNLKAESYMAQFEEFKAKQQLEVQKDKFRGEIEELLDDLKVCDEEYHQFHVDDERWEEERNRFEAQLQDFALRRLETIESEEDLKSLGQIVNEVESCLVSLTDEYDDKVNTKKGLRQEREIQTSRKLLEERLNSPVFPPSVRRAVNDRILVKNENQASTVLRALIEYAIRNHVIRASPAKKRQIWASFIRALNKGGWSFINELEKQRDKSMRRTYGEWLYCPRCLAKYRVAAELVPAVYTCTQCGNPIYKLAPGPIALERSCTSGFCL